MKQNLMYQEEFFGYQINYRYYDSKKALKKALKAEGLPLKGFKPLISRGKDACTHTVTDHGNNSIKIFVVMDFKRLFDDPDIVFSDIVGLLAHEAIHVWQEIKEFLLIETNNKICSRELEAECYQRIFQNMYSELWSQYNETLHRTEDSLKERRL